LRETQKMRSLFVVLFLATCILGMPQRAERSTANNTGCPNFCPFNFAPVCGSDGVTYSNMCSLEIEICERPQDQIQLKHEGPC